MKVAVLVEDAVGGEVVLAVDAHQLSLVSDGGCVVDVGAGLGEAHHHGDVPGGGDDAAHGIHVGLKEAGLEKQVLGGVSGDGQLGKGDQVGTQGAGLLHQAYDLGGVAFQVTDCGVDLGQGQAKGAHLCNPCVFG